MQSEAPGRPHRTSFVIAAAGIAALGGFLFGYDTGVISGAILFISKTFSISTQMKEFVVSIVLVGALCGAMVAGYIADRIGRRRTLLTAGVLFIAGALVSAFATTVLLLLIGRFIVGVAIGFSSVTSPLYISEVSPAGMRGGLVSLYQLAITIGILAAFAIDYSLSRAGAWQWMLGVAVIPALILVLGMIVMPESPRYLFKMGKDTDARAVLRKMRSGADISSEEQSIRDALSGLQIGSRAAIVLNLRFALFVGIGLAVLQQVTGINTVIYYGPQIFQMAGFHSASSSILATAAVGIVNVLLTIVAIVFSDRLGRKPLLYAGCAGMALALVALALSFGVHGLASQRGAIALISLMAYVGCFAFSLGPIVWLLISEIYPLRSRGLGMSVATFSNWTANFVVAQSFLTIISALGQAYTFLLYAGLSVVTIVFVRYAVPETKREELERIEVYVPASPRA